MSADLLTATKQQTSRFEDEQSWQTYSNTLSSKVWPLIISLRTGIVINASISLCGTMYLPDPVTHSHLALYRRLFKPFSEPMVLAERVES